MAAAERVRDVRERLLAAGVVTPRADGRPRALAPVAIGREEGLALYGWVRREGARRTLEVGLGFGITAIVLPRLLTEGRRFDLVFVDGNHRFEGVFLALVYAGRLLAEGGVAFVDDAQLAGVAKAIRFCVSNLSWAVADAGAEGDAHAWTVLRTGTRDALRRPYAEFVDF
jgi:predicted O-methyltransferase YrrM